MENRILNNIDELLQLKNEWDKILEENKNHIPFLELDWIRLWWEHFGKEHELFVILYTDNTNVIGFCPLMITRKKLYSEINFIGHGMASYMDFVFKDQYRERLVESLLEILLNLKGNFLINLYGIFEDSKNYGHISKALSSNKVTNCLNNIKSYYFELPDQGFQSFYNSQLGSRSRKVIRNRESRLNRLGNLVYKQAEESQLEDAFKVYEKRWQRKAENSSFLSKKNKDFLKTLAVSQAPFNTLVSILSLNNRIISFVYSFEYKGRYISKLIAHDDDFEILSPGKIIIKNEIEDCFYRKIQLYDFGLGGEEYKTVWTNNYKNVKNVIFPSDKLTSKLVFLKLYLKIKLKNILKKNERIVYFKNHNLGKIKYLLSRENFLNTCKRIEKAIKREGFWSFVSWLVKSAIDKIYYKKEYQIMESKIEKKEINQSENITFKEVTINDIDLVTDMTNKLPGSIVRRFAKGGKCILAVIDNEIICYCWIDFLYIEIPRINYQTRIEKDSSYIYDCYFKKGFEKNGICLSVFSYLFNYLYDSGHKRCFIAVNEKEKSKISKVYGEVFLPKYVVKGTRIFSRVNNIIEQDKQT